MSALYELYERVGVKIEGEGSSGSGCLFQPKTGDFTYVFTAKHCLPIDLLQPPSSWKSKISITNKFLNEVQVADAFFHDTEDMALILLKRIDDIPRIEAAQIVAQQGVTSYGFPKRLELKDRPAQRIEFNVNFISEKEIELISAVSQMTYCHEPKTNIEGMSGSGIFVETDDQLILVGIFTDLREATGAYQSFCGLRIHLINELLSEAGCESVEIKKSPFSHCYPRPEPYFSRKVYPVPSYDPAADPADGMDAVEILQEQKKMVLLGAAGSGKTTELHRIASFFSSPAEALCPNLVPLNSYTDEEVAAFLQEDWRQVKGKLLVILDGLDEVNSQTFDKLTRKILKFVNTNPGVYVIVSCRANFYRTGDKMVDDKKDHSQGTLRNFIAYQIANLDERQIMDFVSRKLGKDNDFLKKARENKINDLLGVPFYLTQLVELYQENHFPPGRMALFDELLQKAFAWDADHFGDSIAAAKSNIIRMSEKLALTMEAMQKSRISEDEFGRVIPDEELRSLIKHFSWFEKKNNSWSFQHRNFQEFLAAKVLARQTLASLKKFVTFGRELEMIPPLWANTVAFLIPMIKDPDILKWIIRTNPQMLLLSEAERLGAADRTAVCKEIFDNYKAKQIFINHDKYDYRILAQFAQSRDSLLYLLDELQAAQHFTVKYNAILLLSAMRVPRELAERARRELIACGISDGDRGVVSRALLALGRLKLCDEFSAKQIVTRFAESQDDGIRYGLYSFITEGGFSDRFIDVFIEGIPLVRCDLNSEMSRLLNEKWKLTAGLLTVQSISSIEKIVRYFIDSPTDFHELDMDHQQQLDKFTKQLVALNNAGQSKLAIIIQLLVALEGEYPGDGVKVIGQFIEATGTRIAIFSHLLKHSEKNYAVLGAMAGIADEECVNLFISAYQRDSISSYDVGEFRRQLSNNNKPLVKHCDRLIDQLPKEKNIFQAEKQRTKIEDNFQKHFAMLFDKKTFINELSHILTHIDSEMVDFHAVCNLPANITSELVNRLLNNLVFNTPMTKEAIISNFETKDWDWFCVNRVYQYLSLKEVNSLSQEQTRWITEWCDRNQSRVDFRKALEKRTDGGISSSKIAIYLWYFMWKLKIRYPQEKLREMLSFAWYEAGAAEGFEYIATLLTPQDMTRQVLENLEAGIEYDCVLENHLNYCKEQHIVAGLKYALAAMEETERSIVTRRAAMDAAAALSETLSPLEAAIYQVPEDMKWELIDLLLESGSSFDFHSYFVKLLDDSDEKIRFKAADYLIKRNKIEGLRFYEQWLRNNQKMPDFRYNVEGIANLETIAAVPVLFEMLELSYQPNFVQQDRFESLTSIVMRAFMSIAAKSPEGYAPIVEGTKLFIKNNLGKYPNVNFLYSFLERLEHHYVTTNTTAPSMEELLTRLSGLTF